MKYFSTFSGIGGFELGIQQAYEELLDNQSKTARLQTKKNSTNNNSNSLQTATNCVGYSEIDKYAIKVYNKHFNHKNYGDITKINADELPDFDLLVGGFPCQSFSIAGKRGGFEDTRGTMFFELARILRTKKPRLFIFENVKGLLSHDSGRTFKTIIQTLDELGYDLQWQVLNSKYHGVPQNRERVFIVGHTRGTSRPQIFPIREDEEISSETTEPEQSQPQAKPASTIRTKEGTRSDDNFVIVREATRKGYSVAGGGDSINLAVPNSKTRRGRVGKGIAQTLDTGMQQYTLTDSVVRKLTPVECERLQGFPDNWTNEGTDGKISDTQRYKMLGNAVTVNVVEDIVKKLANSL